MRTLIVCSLLMATLVSCLDEQRAEPAKPSTFVRYINGGNPDVAKALEKTSDGGYIILANTTGIVSDTAAAIDRIKLVKVDQYGTVLWSRIYPSTRQPGI